MESITAIMFCAPLQLTSLPEWDREQGLESPPTLPLRLQRAPDGFGFGFYTGSHIGLGGVALSYRNKKHISQMAFGGEFSISNYRFSMDQLYEFYGHRPDSRANTLGIGEASGTGPRFPVSAGVGLYLQTNEVSPAVFNKDRLQDNFGLRFPISMSFVSNDLAIDASVDLSPTLQVLPTLGLGFHAGLGVRFYFFSRDPK